MDKIAGYKLKKPIVLVVEYDDCVICLQNDELSLVSCGDTIDGALQDLEPVFETLVEEYLLESDDVLSDKALELKQKLAEYVDVSASGADKQPIS